jgi:hypothetical protein
MGLGAAILVVIFPSAYRVVGSFGYQILLFSLAGA